MMKKIVIVIAALFLLAGCAKQPHKVPAKRTAPVKSASIIVNTPVTKTYTLQPFHAIVVNSGTVELENGSYAMVVHGLPQEISQGQVRIANKTLFVDSAPAANNRALLKIIAPGLQAITVSNTAAVIAKDFKSENLTITAQGSGTINLEGAFCVNQIYQNGNGRIDINWIDSDKLFISSSTNGPIYLAGQANNIIAKLTGPAMLEARYLRVQKASVFTTDTARADVLALDTLGAFAVDKSNIYYYKIPEHLTIVTKGSGNVLHTDWVH